MIGGLAYPLMGMLNGGIPIDVQQLMEEFGLPLTPDGKRSPLLPALIEAKAATTDATESERVDHERASKT
jgi:hypothetical protein